MPDSIKLYESFGTGSIPVGLTPKRNFLCIRFTTKANAMVVIGKFNRGQKP